MRKERQRKLNQADNDATFTLTSALAKETLTILTKLTRAILRNESLYYVVKPTMSTGQREFRTDVHA